MSWKPETFTKSSGFEITDGAYQIAESNFVIPNPTSEDPVKQKKIDAIAPVCVWRHVIHEVDENNDVIDATKPKTLDLKFGELSKVRPADELSDDIADGDTEKGFVGRYAVPSSYSPHENSKAGFFVNSLVNHAGFDPNRIPDANDAKFLEGFILRIRPKPQEGVKNQDGTRGEPWNQYEVYEIVYDPGSKPAKGSKKATAATAAPAKAKAAAPKAKPAPEPEPEPEEQESTEEAGDGEFDATEKATELLQQTAADLKKKNKPVNVTALKIGVVTRFSILPADQQKEVRPLVNNADFIQAVIDSL